MSYSAKLHYRLLGFPLVFFQAGMQCFLLIFSAPLSIGKEKLKSKAVILWGFSQPGQNKRNVKQC